MPAAESYAMIGQIFIGCSLAIGALLVVISIGYCTVMAFESVAKRNERRHYNKWCARNDY